MLYKDLTTIDLLGEELTSDPYAYYETIQSEAPIHYNELHRAWLISRYDDVSEAFFDPALSSDRIRPLLDSPSSTSVEKPPPVLEVLSKWMVVTDPPAHTRLRRLANIAFKSQQINKMTTWIGEIVDSLLDEMIENGSQDFIKSLAFPLPATVIAKMLGAPVEDSPKFQYWSDELALVAFGAGGEDRANRHERAYESVVEMHDYLRDLIFRAKASPKDDLISELTKASNQTEDPLNEDELLGLCTLILFAGHETTTNLLCNAILTLTAHPEQLEELKQNPALTAGAVEEVLRYHGPIKTLQRWVVEDHERHGQQLKTGDRVFLMLGAANRDPHTFEQPQTFDIKRSSNPLHMAFGRGPHSCLGAQLARLEARIALPKIIERLPELEVIGRTTFKPSLAAKAVNGLQVSYKNSKG